MYLKLIRFTKNVKFLSLFYVRGYKCSFLANVISYSTNIVKSRIQGSKLGMGVGHIFHTLIFVIFSGHKYFTRNIRVHVT